MSVRTIFKENLISQKREKRTVWKMLTKMVINIRMKTLKFFFFISSLNIPIMLDYLI